MLIEKLNCNSRALIEITEEGNFLERNEHFASSIDSAVSRYHGTAY